MNYGCISPLVEILTKRNSTFKQRKQALTIIDLILEDPEDKKHSHIHAVEKEGGVEAITKLQVFYSFDFSSCVAIWNLTLCAG